ncbi:MAG: hypothetical protein WBB19_10100 [Desulforhopalus sp.]
MYAVHGVIGIVLLTMGRKLFWLFVGCAGFLAGLQVAQQYFGVQSFWIVWAAALLFGLIGALLTVFFQKVAIILGGYAAGSTIAAYLTVLAGFATAPVINVVGGILGAVVLYALFDWALIGLSSLVGATLIVQLLNLTPRTEIISYVVLIAAGGVFQTFMWRSQNSKTM